VAIVAPDDRTSGVIRVIGVSVTPEYGVVRGVRMIQLGQIDIVPIVGVILEVAKNADTKQSDDREEDGESRHLYSLFVNCSFVR